MYQSIIQRLYLSNTNEIENNFFELNALVQIFSASIHLSTPQSILQRFVFFYSVSHLTPHTSHLTSHTSYLTLQTSDFRPQTSGLSLHESIFRVFVHLSLLQSMIQCLIPCLNASVHASALQAVSQNFNSSRSVSVHLAAPQSTPQCLSQFFHASVHFSVFQFVFQNLNPSFSVSVHSSVTLSILQCLNPSQEYLVRPDRVLRGGAPGW